MRSSCNFILKLRKNGPLGTVLFLLLFIIGCNSEMATLTSIRRTPITLTTSNIGTFTKVLIYGSRAGGSEAFANFHDTTPPTIDRELINGEWTFYGLAYNNFSISTCAITTVSVAKVRQYVNLDFSNATCGNPVFLGTNPQLNPSMTDIAFSTTRLEFCESVQGITNSDDECTDDLSSVNRKQGRGHASSFRYRLMAFEKTNGVVTTTGNGFDTPCVNSTPSAGSYRGLSPTQMGFNLPAGDGATTPFLIRMKIYPASTACSTGTPATLDLPNGVVSNTSQAKYVIQPGAPATHKLYLKMAEEEICQGDALALVFAGGDGSISSPRLICNETQLYNIFPNTTVAADYSLSAAKSYKLLTDIDLSDNSVTGSGYSPPWASCVEAGSNFMPIGRTYDGTTCASANIPIANFDGSGHSIKGLKIKNSLATSTGFYGTLSSGGLHHIQRLTFIDSVIEGTGRTGTVAGLATNAHFRDLVLVNPSVSAPVYDRIGGLVGDLEAGSIQNILITDLNLTARDYVGGLVGITVFSVTPPSITKAYVNGIINGREIVGGMVGMHNYTTTGTLATISNSKFSGSINTTEQFTGGLIGWAYTTRIENSYAQVAFNSTFAGSPFLGGIVGYFVDNTAGGLGGVYSSYASWSVSDICGNGALCYIGEVVGNKDPSYDVQHFDTTVYVAESALGLTTAVVGSSQPSTTFLDASPGWTKADTSSLMGFFLPSVWIFSDFQNPKLVDEP